MFKSGLVSVTFRNLSVDEIVTKVKECGLSGIEWGSDVHVKPGDIETAKRVKKLCDDAEIEVFAYGSYYKAGENENPYADFKPVLDTAVALGAPSIRVWAGTKWSWRADEAYVERVINDTRIICDMAAEYNIDICYEYHGWSLTDTRFSAVDTKKLVDRENLKLYWQPNFTLSTEDNLLAVQMVLPYLDNVHVFYWDCCEGKFPLSDGRELWTRFTDIIKRDGKNHNFMLEFVKDGSLEQLRDDAKTLNELLK